MAKISGASYTQLSPSLCGTVVHAQIHCLPNTCFFYQVLDFFKCMNFLQMDAVANANALGTFDYVAVAVYYLLVLTVSVYVSYKTYFF